MLSVGFTMIAVSPRQPPQPYLRHGCGPSLHLDVKPIGFHSPTRSHRGATLRLPRIPLILKPLFYTSIPGRTKARPYKRHIINTLTVPQTPNNRISSPLTSYHAVGVISPLLLKKQRALMHPLFLLTFDGESLRVLRFSALYLTITFSILLPALTM